MKVSLRRWLVFIVASLPLWALLLMAYQDELGAEPIQYMTHYTGEWALSLLLLSLAVTPAVRWLGWRWCMPHRRMLGLFAFFYASLHVLVYLLLDQSLDMAAIIEDIVKRPYVTVGFAGFVVLLVLAVTSTRGMQQRLKKAWKRIHRGVYLAAVLALIHFMWLVKKDLSEPLFYALVFVLLMALRYQSPRSH